MAFDGQFIMGVSIHPARTTIFSAWLLAEVIIRQWLSCGGPFHILTLQLVSATFHFDLAMPLKRVERFSPATLRNFLDGGRDARSGRHRWGVKRSVRVQAFTCSRSL